MRSACTRFQQEARAVVGLNHPNILTVYEIGEDDSSHYIASELIEGETLRQHLARGRMGLDEALDVAIQIATALAAAHQAGIVHRDIKPENIMLRPDGYVKVLDFGIAKLAEQEVPATMAEEEALLLVETNLGSILGTVRYMSPEQARGAPVDKCTDIWSLGVVLYEMVSGQAPFTGDTPGEVMASILGTEPPLLSSIAQTPAELQQIVSKALSKERERRYQSAHEMLEALKSFRRGMEFKAELERSTAAPLWRRWTRSPTVLVLVLLVAALALAFPFYWQRNLTTGSIPEKSIAVLPFENISDNKENSYFAAGIQDDVLTSLAQIHALKVIGRTSVMQYKSGIARNLKEIAQQLGVSKVVEGSVRRSGNHVRVSVQLIDALTDRHIWAENYDRTLADSLALQGELATEIAASVGATLTPQEKARVQAQPTNNADAYDAYLRGRAITILAMSERANLDRAVRSYEEAVKLDPNFALAWVYLSRAQSIYYRNWPSPARLAAAKDALDRALALDPNLPEAHLARGYYRFQVERDCSGALSEFQKAEQGLPNNADVFTAISMIQRRRGRSDEAIEAARRAVALDPRNRDACFFLATTYGSQRRFRESRAVVDRVLAFDPTDRPALNGKVYGYLLTGDLKAAEPLLADPNIEPGAHGLYAFLQRNYAAAAETFSKTTADDANRDWTEVFALGICQQRTGNVAAARETFQGAIQGIQRELAQTQPDPLVQAALHGLLGVAYALLGEAAPATSEGEKAIALRSTSEDLFDGPPIEETVAQIYATLGDADHAVPILQRLLQMPYRNPITTGRLRVDPFWDPIRNDSRFQELAAEKPR